MKKHVLGVCLLAVMICLASGSAKAQNVGKISLFGGYSFLHNNWGNNCVGSCLGGVSTELHGYTVSAAYNFNDHFGMEANFAGHHGSPTIFSVAATDTSNGFAEFQSQDFYTYTFGPKLMQALGNFSIFSHFLVGGDHGHEAFTTKCLQSAGSGSPCSASSGTSAHGSGFAFKTGGGSDWHHGRWGFRILEVDYIRASTFITETCTGCTQPLSFSISGNNFELSTGVTLNFGTR